MLPILVVILILVVVMFIVAHRNLIGSQKYRYQQSAQATQEYHVGALTHYALSTAKSRAILMSQIQEGAFSSATKPAFQPSTINLPPSWYRRLRTYISLSFLLMVLLTLFVQSGLADGTLMNISSGLSFLGYSHFTTTDVQTVAHTAAINASQQLVRISQLDPNQYASQSEYNTWAYSACSTASMTEVFNAYGRHYRITDVLQVEAQIGAITPQLGLTDRSGIAATAAQVGFKTISSYSWSLDQVINIANSGKPMIVDFPPDRYAGGHLLVLIGGNDTTVYLADSSSWNHQALSRAQFLQWWGGFGAVVTPN